MRLTDIALRLNENAQVFRHLLAAVEPAQARWKPDPEKWSLLEVINHLADEERYDFRAKIDLMLHHPGQQWTPIDPPQWVIERRYNDRDVAESLTDFLGERQRSVVWLKAVEGANFAAEYRHPKLGTIRLGDLLGSWLAHDLIHIRQVTRLHYEYLSATCGHSLSYAGRW